MSTSILASLRTVRSWQRRQLLLRGLTMGLFVSGIVGVGLGAARLALGQPIAPPLMTLSLLIGPLSGLLWAFVRRLPLQRAAAEIDSSQHLKERATTALEFLAKTDKAALHELQLEDAARHLGRIDARSVAPLRLPKLLPYAVTCTAAGVALLLWPLTAPPALAQLSAPPPHIVAEAERVKEDLQKLEELARAQENPELEELAKDLQKLAEEMKQPGVDQREALAKLSEMQAAIAAFQAQYNVELMDAQLAALGTALSQASAFQSLGQALQKGEYDKAAEELDKETDLNQLDRRDAKAVAEKMKQVAGAMRECNLSELAGTTTELAQSISECDNEGFKKCAGKLAQSARKQAKRREAKKYLVCELDRLNECKGNCKGGEMKAKGKKPEKSDTPSSDWGLTTSGNIEGKKTELDSQRMQDQITGTLGDGSAEVETLHSPEGAQKAGRAYHEKYEEYRKLSEAVLEGEPLPLGHRALIRRYFELIRPQNPANPPAQAQPEKPEETRTP